MLELALDAHSHCGITVPYDGLAQDWELGGIHGGVVFPPAEEIYDRSNPQFTDSEEYRKSRRRVHKYLLQLSERATLFPYYFVWNDFGEIPEGFRGIKWHRHPGEPLYDYGSAECAAMIQRICEAKFPVVLEEEFTNTLNFVMRVAERTVVIIPHLGGLNGGYQRLKSIGVFENRMVWADTALATSDEILDFAGTYGTDRLLFGSDYPFGVPLREREKCEELFSGSDRRGVLAGNLLRLLGIGQPEATEHSNPGRPVAVR